MTSPIGDTVTLPPDYSMANVKPSKMDEPLLDPQAFLKLLVAQLKYQDPTKPVDTAAFMEQTATLSQVQTMTSMSTALTTLATGQQVQAATSMIGKQVTYTDDSGLPQTGVVSAATLSGGTATLKIGTASVPMTRVTEVSAAPVIAGTTETPTAPESTTAP